MHAPTVRLAKFETGNKLKHEKKRTKMPFFYNVFVPWEAETTANSKVFEGQVAKNAVIYSVF